MPMTRTKASDNEISPPNSLINQIPPYPIHRTLKAKKTMRTECTARVTIEQGLSDSQQWSKKREESKTKRKGGSLFSEIGQK